MQLSPLLSLRPTPSKGRAVFAVSPLSTGTAVLHALPYAIGVFPSHRKRLCSYLPCSLTSGTYFTVHCPGCDAAYYCSSQCRERDEGKHAWICGGLRKLKGFAKDRHVAGVMVLVLEVLARAKVEVTASSDEADEDDNLREDVYSAVFHPEPGEHRVPLLRPTWTDVLALQSHFASWSTSDREDWTRHSAFLLSVLSACKPGLLPEGWGLDDVLNLASKAESNGFGLFVGEENHAQALQDEDGKVNVHSSLSSRGRKGAEAGGGGGVCFARGLYPHASFFNHSCEPNAQADPVTALEVYKTPPADDGVQGEAVPLEHIRKIGLGRPLTFSIVLPEGDSLPVGEEVTISYVSVSLPRSTRRAQLGSEYYFDCICTRCEEEGHGKTKVGKKKIVRKKGKA